MHRSPAEYIDRRRPLSSFNGSPSSPARDDSARLDLAVLSQRISSMEDRLTTLEQLLSRTAAKVDQMGEKSQSDTRSVDMLRVQFRELEQLDVAGGKAANERMDGLERSFDNRLKGIASEVDTLRSSVSASSQRNLDRDASERQRLETQLSALRDAVGANQTQFRSTINTAMRTMQGYVRKQIDTSATESILRLDQFEKDRTDIQENFRGMSTAMNGIRDEISSIRSEHDQYAKTIRDSTQGLTTAQGEIKVLQRRLSSALRHLSHDAPAVSSFGEDTSTSMAASPSRIHPRSSPVRSSPPRGRDDDIDRFLSELNAMTSHVVQ